MTNKRVIKIFVVTFIIAAVSVILVFRWNKKGSDWGKGELSVCEASYYKSGMERIINNWIGTRDNANFSDDGYYDDSYQSYLIFDLEKQALWLEDSGRILKDNYLELPTNLKWTFYHITLGKTIELTNRIILKYRGFDTNKQTPEAFYLVGTSRSKGYIICQIQGSKGIVNYSTEEFAMPQFNFPTRVKNNLFGSLIVSNDEYQQYRDFLPDLNLAQPGSMSQFEQNKEAWFKIEMRLYKEIQKHVRAKGFKLTMIEVKPGQDFSAGYSKISAPHNNRILLRIFGGISRLDMTLNIDYLGNDNWYVKGKDNSGLNPNQASKYDLEFVLNANKKITKSEYNKLLEKGREIQKPFVIPVSKWQTTLSNGMKIEILGICENPSAGKTWWGPDGTLVDYVPYESSMEYEKPNENSKVYEFVWRITHRPTNFGIGTTFEGSDGANHTIYNDRYGLSLWPTNSVNIQTFSFNKSKVKANFVIKLSQGNTSKQTILFKNISLVPGQDQGFEIEVVEPEE